MQQTPLFIALKDRKVLVVGGGKTASRKVRVLLEGEATVHIISPDLSTALGAAHASGIVSYQNRLFEDGDISDQFLVIAATNDSSVNANIASIAQRKNILVNVVDAPDLCTFMFPSILTRDPIKVAISSTGTSPMLARHLREKLETTVPGNYGELAKFIAEHRRALKTKIKDGELRRKFWHEVIEGSISELVLSGRTAEANDAINTLVEKFQHLNSSHGEVYLVGAGPGDPDLLTFKALRLMQKADVIVYDRLVAPKILDRCRREAEMIYVGKRKEHHSVAQTSINEMLVELAQQGKNVCRLKGGDPFVFGRGGEEIDQLSQAGINFQIVPGISAANGCAAYAGIPLTHRDYAHSVTFIAGHRANDEIDWKALCNPDTTLVFYMGLGNLEKILNKLIEQGISPQTPAACIEQGTTNNQRVHTGVVASLLQTVKCANVVAPTIIIIGDVVKLHQRLCWYQPTTYFEGSVFSSGSEES